MLSAIAPPIMGSISSARCSLCCVVIAAIRQLAGTRHRSDGGTHLARVDLLAAEGVVVGTHVGGVGVIPVC
jgi:hypothetical protein